MSTSSHFQLWKLIVHYYEGCDYRGGKITFQDPEKRHPSADVGARTGIRFRNASRVHLRPGYLGSVTRVRGETVFAEASALRHY